MRIAALCFLIWSVAPAAAQIRPVPGPGDPRIQTVVYDANQVVQLRVAAGYQLTVKFAPGERIETVAVGDSGNWAATPNKGGDHLFIKVTGVASTTNMTVVTDTRSYAFELEAGSGLQADMAYTVGFTYPVLTKPDQRGDGAATAIGRYRLSGTRALRPSAISDDGIRTYIEFPVGLPLPAIFVTGATGRETLANGAMRDGQYVIDGVKPELVFRINRRVARAHRLHRR